jgi:hypothetical protein
VIVLYLLSSSPRLPKRSRGAPRGERKDEPSRLDHDGSGYVHLTFIAVENAIVRIGAGFIQFQRAILAWADVAGGRPWACGSVRHVGVPHSSPVRKFAPNLNTSLQKGMLPILDI